jgi:hypothetical protein
MSQILTRTLVNDTFDSFIICRTFQKSIGIVSTFKKELSKYIGPIEVLKSRQHRVEELIEMIPFPEANETESGFSIDCIKNVDENTDAFKQHPKVREGIFHYNVIDEENTYVIHPRLFIGYDPQDIELIDVDFNFESTDLKIFSVIMERGFITAISNGNMSVLYVTILNAKDKFVGNCVSVGNKHMVNNIKRMWPFIQSKQNGRLIKVSIDAPIDVELKYINLFKFIHLDGKTTMQHLGKSYYIT